MLDAVVKAVNEGRTTYLGDSEDGRNSIIPYDGHQFALHKQVFNEKRSMFPLENIQEGSNEDLAPDVEPSKFDIKKDNFDDDDIGGGGGIGVVRSEVYPGISATGSLSGNAKGLYWIRVAGSGSAPVAGEVTLHHLLAVAGVPAPPAVRTATA